MLDSPDQVARLLASLRAALPLSATMTPHLVDLARTQLANAGLSSACKIVWVDHAGDEGGIVCRIEPDDQAQGRALVVSITHLVLRGRAAFTRDLLAYQKRRMRKLRRLGRSL